MSFCNGIIPAGLVANVKIFVRAHTVFARGFCLNCVEKEQPTMISRISDSWTNSEVSRVFKHFSVRLLGLLNVRELPR